VFLPATGNCLLWYMDIFLLHCRNCCS